MPPNTPWKITHERENYLDPSLNWIHLIKCRSFLVRYFLYVLILIPCKTRFLKSRCNHGGLLPQQNNSKNYSYESCLSFLLYLSRFHHFSDSPVNIVFWEKMSPSCNLIIKNTPFLFKCIIKVFQYFYHIHQRYG